MTKLVNYVAETAILNFYIQHLDMKHADDLIAHLSKVCNVSEDTEGAPSYIDFNLDKSVIYNLRFKYESLSEAAYAREELEAQVPIALDKWVKRKGGYDMVKPAQKEAA